MKYLEAVYYLTIIFLLGFILFVFIDTRLSTRDSIANAIIILFVAFMFGIYRKVGDKNEKI